MRKIKPYLILLICIQSSLNTYSQSLYTRIQSDISIKEIFADGNKSLMMGKVFFDLEENSLVYHISFPEKEIMVIKDSIVLSLKYDSLRKTTTSPQLIDFSIYKLALKGNMKTFGIDQSKFILGNITDEGDKIISEWIPKTENAPFKIVISQKNNLIDGIAIFDEQGIIKSKQIFKEYKKYGRISFPHQIYEISYSEAGEYKKLMKHSNIKLNNYSDEDSFYIPNLDGSDRK